MMSSQCKPPAPPRRARHFDEGVQLATVRDASCVCFVDESAEHANLAGATWERVELRRSSVGSAALHDAAVADAWLDCVDAANVDAVRTSFVRTRVTGGRWRGAGLLLAHMSDLTCTDVDFDLSRWRGARVDRARFVNCSLRDSDLSDMELRDVEFVGCDLSAADLTGTLFERCRFAGCTFDEVRGVASLVGVSLSVVDALAGGVAWARALGARIS